MEGIKRYLVLFLVCFVIASCSNQVEKINQWKEYELKGKVETLKTCTYSASEKFGEIVKDTLIEIKIVYFNKNGLIDSVFRVKNNKQNVELYEWNLENNICVIKEKEDNATYAEVQYNKQFNRLLSWVNYQNDSLKSKQIYIYNEKLQLIDYSYYDETGKLYWRYKDYEYNEQGLLKSEKQYDEKGNLDDKHLYQYDEKGNMIAQKWENDYRRSKFSFFYNEDGFVYRRTYNYKSKRSDYSFIDITEYTYVMDKKGNYIVKTEKEYDENDRSEVECKYIEREITYFN